MLSGVGVLSSHDNLGRWGFANPVLLHVWWAYVFSEVVERLREKVHCDRSQGPIRLVQLVNRFIFYLLPTSVF